jgi:hypothetical protein
MYVVGVVHVGWLQTSQKAQSKQPKHGVALDICFVCLALLCSVFFVFLVLPHCLFAGVDCKLFL